MHDIARTYFFPRSFNITITKKKPKNNEYQYTYYTNVIYCVLSRRCNNIRFLYFPRRLRVLAAAAVFDGGGGIDG